jgi:hypothetical protein
LLHGVADQLVRYDIEAFSEAFKDEPPGGGNAGLTMLAAQMMRIREEPHLSRTRARVELSMLSKRDADIAVGFQEVFASYRSLAERLVVGMQPAVVDRALVAEQTSVLLTFLSGLVFGFANGSAGPTSREHVEHQIRAVILGVAAERG